jgi:hypothetical protein
VSHTEQPPLDIHFFQSPEHESAEFHVVFDVSENGFWLSAALLAQGQTLLREQVLSSLLPVASQFKIDLDAAIALGLGAFWFEWTGGTIGAFVKPAL